jgi:outer membrane lipoprotein-sorting protein
VRFAGNFAEQGLRDRDVNILRRLPLSRLLLLCAVVVGVGVSATAIAFAVGAGPVPKEKPLAEAVHDALAAPPVEGVSASVVWTNHLLEGANLAGTGVQGAGGELLSSPLITGASGRLWIAKDGHVRLELQSESGDTQVISDGHTLEVYDAASNTLYRYTPPAHEASSPPPAGPEPATPDSHETPSAAKIQETISHLEQHWDVSRATPSDVAGQPAYTVRVSPKEGGSLLAGSELAWDANNGAPLRAAVYSTENSSPAIELAASEVSFGPVESSVFSFTPPASAKVEEVSFGNGSSTSGSGATGASGPTDTEKPTLTTHGQGPSTIAVLETKTKPGESTSSETLERLPKVTINGTKASELRTELGTLLTFVRSGVRYVVAGAVPTAAVEEVARGL